VLISAGANIGQDRFACNGTNHGTNQNAEYQTKAFCLDGTLHHLPVAYSRPIRETTGPMMGLTSIDAMMVAELSTPSQPCQIRRTNSGVLVEGELNVVGESIVHRFPSE
jgi:hypothetical protein